MIDAPERVVSLGHPSYVWRSGQERRLTLIRRYVPLEGRRILDVGCGMGLRTGLAPPDRVYGVDIEEKRCAEALDAQPALDASACPFLMLPDVVC
jgi:predicted RNA methylase